MTLIATRLMDVLCKRLQSLGYGCSVSADVPPYLAGIGFDTAYGARPLRRTIREKVEDPLAEKLLSGAYEKGDVIHISVVDDVVAFH